MQHIKQAKPIEAEENALGQVAKELDEARFVSLAVEINPRFYRREEKGCSKVKNGELKADEVVANNQ